MVLLISHFILNNRVLCGSDVMYGKVVVVVVVVVRMVIAV